MKRNTATVIAFIIMITSFFLTSCGGGGGGGAAAPEVAVTTVNNGNTGDGSSVSGSNSGSSGGTISINTGTDTGNNSNGTGQDSVPYFLIILTDNDGNLNINYEKINSDSYNSSTISSTDENGNMVEAAIEEDGSIKITPSDGTVEGTYTIVITIDDREYLLVVSVDAYKNRLLSHQ